MIKFYIEIKCILLLRIYIKLKPERGILLLIKLLNKTLIYWNKKLKLLTLQLDIRYLYFWICSSFKTLYFQYKKIIFENF